MNSNPLVYIIVLNWNNYADTFECLSSLNKIDYPNFKVILVDNASNDDSAAKLKRSFPGITMLKNTENLGFAEGNNVGIRYALGEGADHVLLLNNDTVVEPNFLSVLVGRAEAEPDIGILGPKIYFADSSVIWFAGGKLNHLTGFTFHLGEGILDRGQFGETFDMDFASGCAMLIKKVVFEKIGFLDKDYYHSHEDADFCLRAGRIGYRVEYIPGSVIYHKLSRSSGGRRSALYLYYRTRNHLLFKNKRNIKAPLFWPIFMFLIFKRILGSFLLGQPKGALATVRGIYDYYAGNWVKGSGDSFR